MSRSLSLVQDAERRFRPVDPSGPRGQSWRGFSDYGFARDYRTVPLMLDEVVLAASAFPIFFEPVTDSAALVVGLLDTGEARVIGETGRWGAAYVPGALRIHPFFAGSDGQVLIDPDSDCLTVAPQGTRIFDTTGQPTDAFAQVQNFCKAFGPAVYRGLRATTALGKAGVLIPADARHGLTGEHAEGLWAVDPKALSALPGATLQSLAESDALMLAYAHLVSLPKIGQLKTVERLRQSSDMGSAPTEDQQVAGVDAFLAALADAHSKDGSGS